MAITTPNYYLPEFEDKETIDLINVYNKAMQIIDNQLNIINDKIDHEQKDLAELENKVSHEQKDLAELENKVSYAMTVMMQNPDTDKKLDESSIQKARIGSSGYVYISD